MYVLRPQRRKYNLFFSLRKMNAGAKYSFAIIDFHWYYMHELAGVAMVIIFSLSIFTECEVLPIQNIVEIFQ